MNRKTKVGLRREAEAQASRQRASYFGQVAYAAMLSGTKMRMENRRTAERLQQAVTRPTEILVIDRNAEEQP